MLSSCSMTVWAGDKGSVVAVVARDSVSDETVETAASAHAFPGFLTKSKSGRAFKGKGVLCAAKKAGTMLGTSPVAAAAFG